MYLTRSPSFSKNPRSAATRNGSAVQFEPLVQPTFNTLGSAAFVAVTDAMARTIENRNRNKRPIEFIAFSLDSAAPLRLFLGASFLIPADARVSTKNPCFCGSKVNLSGVNGNVIMSGWADDNRDNER